MGKFAGNALTEVKYMVINTQAFSGVANHFRSVTEEIV
jgi:hypothetical protein